MRYKEGGDRQQLQFFTRLDELVDTTNYVRLIDAFVDSFMDNFISAFNKGDKDTGRKAIRSGQ